MAMAEMIRCWVAGEMTRFMVQTGYFVDDSTFHSELDTAIYRIFETPLLFGGGTVTSYELIGVISGASGLDLSMDCFDF